MTYMPDNDETWEKTTDGRPLKIGDNIYFMKTRTAQTQPALFVPNLAVQEQNMKPGLMYKLRIKTIADGRVFNVSMSFKKSLTRDGSNRWPLYGMLPNCGLEAGIKVYARLEPLDMIEWFNDDTERAPEDMWRH